MHASTPAFARIRPQLVAIIALSVLLAFAVRVPFFFWPLTVDEAGYAYGARWWFDGLTMYSDELWFDRPQGIFLAYQSGMAFLGGSTEAIRVIGAIWSMATTALVVLIAARMFGLRVAAIAGPLFAVMSVAPLIDGYAANAEVFMIAAATASAYCLWQRRWLGAGLFLGVAILLKPSGAVGLLLGLAWLFNERAARRDWALFLAGTGLPLLLAFIHGALTVGVGDYLYAIAFFRLTTGGEGDPLLQLIEGWSRVMPVIFPLILVALVGRRALHAHPIPYRFLSIWIGTASLGIAMGGNWWEHYFLQALPPLILIVAVVLEAWVLSAWRSGRGVLSSLGRLSTQTGAASVGVVAAAVAFVALILPWAVMDPVEGSTQLYDMNGYQGNEEIAGYLADRTEPSDEVLIGLSHASLLYLTGRLNSSPYLYKQQSSEIPGAIQDIADEVARGVPAYVLVLPFQLELYDPDGLIWEALRDRYEYDRSFRSAEVWRRR